MYDQQYIDNLPKMQVRAARQLGKKGRAKIGLKHFHSEFSCGECGCYIRVCSDALNRVFCANCSGSFKGCDVELPFKDKPARGVKLTPIRSQDATRYSVASIKFQEACHNKNVLTARKENWRIPTVFSSNIK